VPHLISRATPRPRRSLALALLATVAPAALLGGCSTGPLWGKNDPSSSERLADNTDPNAPGATAQWASAYAKSPQDPRMALGYARALKAIGSRDQALEVLKVSYQTNPNGEVAAELGRLALDMGRLDIAKATLQVAEAQGVRDWKTLSAQGTLRAKQGNHAEAQQYYLAALQLQPDAVSVINNLALSYALDNKVDRAEELLRKAVETGHEDKRVRQNLALVLGLEGKYTEARQLAAIDLPEADAKANMAYLRNMLTKPTEMASLGAGGSDEVDAVPDGKGTSDWKAFAGNKKPTAAKPAASVAQAQPKAKTAQVATVQAPTPAATLAAPTANPTAATTSVASKQTVAQTTASSAPAARTATLLPAEGGSSTVPKSPPPSQVANAQVKGPELAPAATLLRTNVEQKPGL
jgi:Flp pilus assembly protein TadD